MDQHSKPVVQSAKQQYRVVDEYGRPVARVFLFFVKFNMIEARYSQFFYMSCNFLKK